MIIEAMSGIARTLYGKGYPVDKCTMSTEVYDLFAAEVAKRYAIHRHMIESKLPGSKIVQFVTDCGPLDIETAPCEEHRLALFIYPSFDQYKKWLCNGGGDVGYRELVKTIIYGLNREYVETMGLEKPGL